MTERTANRIFTDLRTVRTALDLLTEGHSQYAVAKRLGYCAGTIRGWRLRAMREPEGWPTLADIDAWQADTDAQAARRAHNAARVASIRSFTRTHGHGRKVPGIGTVRRLRALIAIGWSQSDLAARLGVTQQQVSLLTRGIHPEVHVSTREAVTRLYDQLSMTVPTHRPAHSVNRTRADAARKGWAPPLAWDDDQIDNPDAQPEGMATAA